MLAGTLRKRVTLQTRSTVTDAYGGQTTAWTNYLTGIPADIQSLSGRELLAAQAVQSETSHMIVMRYSPMLADSMKVAAMRVVYVNAGVTRYFNISSCLNEDERNRQITLMASEGLNVG